MSSPIARSPVFSHLSSSLQGLSTIRAFKSEERFQQTFDSHQDLHSGITISALTKWFTWVSSFNHKSAAMDTWLVPINCWLNARIKWLNRWNQMCYCLLRKTCSPSQLWITLNNLSYNLQSNTHFNTHHLYTEACFLFLSTSRWFAVRLDGMCSIFVTITAFGCLLLRNSEKSLYEVYPLHSCPLQ